MKNFYQIKSFSAIFILALFSFAITSCKNDKKGVIPTISQTVVGLADFSQLELSAIKCNFVVALSNKNTAAGSNGDYTVFAPTNQAFAKIGLINGADLNALQTPFLKNVLNYHLSNGRTKDEELLNSTSLLSLMANKDEKKIFIRAGEKYVNGSKIIATNIKADNGVVHAIDRVLLASGTDITNTAIFFSEGKGFVKPELTFLVAAVIYCDLITTLADASKKTVFAPTDQAFKNLGVKLGVALNQPSDITKLDKATLTNILRTHVIATNAYFTSQLYAGPILTASGKNITLGEYENGYLSVKGAGNSAVAKMVIPDIQATNGVIHVIDSVLLP